MWFQVGICPGKFNSIWRTIGHYLHLYASYLASRARYIVARPFNGPAIKQNVRFQGGISPEKCQIQNGRLEAIIDFNMGDIAKTVPNSSDY